MNEQIIIELAKSQASRADALAKEILNTRKKNDWISCESRPIDEAIVKFEEICQRSNQKNPQKTQLRRVQNDVDDFCFVTIETIKQAREAIRLQREIAPEIEKEELDLTEQSAAQLEMQEFIFNMKAQ